jgi:hypothetical protein
MCGCCQEKSSANHSALAPGDFATGAVWTLHVDELNLKRGVWQYWSWRSLYGDKSFEGSCEVQSTYARMCKVDDTYPAKMSDCRLPVQNVKTIYLYLGREAAVSHPQMLS